MDKKNEADDRKGDKKEGKGQGRGGTQNCGNFGPGPQYTLPPLIGYKGHDVTKWRGAAYTMGRHPVNYSKKQRDSMPGPQYNLTGFDRFGKQSSPKWTFGHKRSLAAKFIFPGPGAYNQSTNSKKRYPAWTMQGKMREPKLNQVPGPIYDLPKPKGRSAYLFGMPKEGKIQQTPGPNHYGTTPVQLFKRRVPSFTFGLLPGRRDRSGETPGPGSYAPNTKNLLRAPGFTFGVRHTPCRAIFFTKQDLEFN